MSTLDSASQQGVSAEVEPTFHAARVVTKPYDYQQYGTGGVTRVLGHYRAVYNTAAALLAANSNLLGFRYTDASSFALIQRINVWAVVAAAVTAQRIDPLTAIMGRGYTVQFTSNISTANLAGNNGKARSIMGSSNASIVFSSAAAGLGGATVTTDANPFAQIGLNGLGALGTAAGGDLYNVIQGPGPHPVMLANNEGFIIQWGATAVATGTVYVGIEVDWAEVATF